MTRKPGRPAVQTAAAVDDVAGMVILAGSIAAITSRRHAAPVKPDDPLLRDWADLARCPDPSWPRMVQDFDAFRLLASELERWARQFGGPHGELLRRRAAWLRSDKTPGEGQ